MSFFKSLLLATVAATSAVAYTGDMTYFNQVSRLSRDVGNPSNLTIYTGSGLLRSGQDRLRRRRCALSRGLR
jgi:hypothetical protein